MSACIYKKVEKITNKEYDVNFTEGKYQSCVKEIFAEKVKPCCKYSISYNVIKKGEISFDLIAVMKIW